MTGKTNGLAVSSLFASLRMGMLVALRLICPMTFRHLFRRPDHDDDRHRPADRRPIDRTAPEAGDLTQPRFEPVDGWLRKAAPAAQKTAMWRWFATRYEEIEAAETNRKKASVEADKVLRKRFAAAVPSAVLEALIADVKRRRGNAWATLDLDKLSS
jgi:hypothetical protein